MAMQTDAFPRLEDLSVTECPKLKGHLPKHLRPLRSLCIEWCEQLVTSNPRAVEIEGVKMETSSFNKLELLVFDTPLESLSIYSCPGINIPINHCYHFVEYLDISCHSLTTFPLHLFPKLNFLYLLECDNLHMISQEHPHDHLNKLAIIKCSEFESFPNEGLSAPELQEFHIIKLEKLLVIYLTQEKLTKLFCFESVAIPK